ncbi:MAG: L,D-transpeptidase family protein [Alphaproteobacteria bacterium]|nr:L,D-transpeptidase family protein [Alphaproteobacteria bacterium]
MTDEDTKNVFFATRRSILRKSLGLAAAAGTLPISRQALAQSDAWWQSIIGHGAGTDSDSAPQRRRKKYELGDLRTGSTPWLSDVTLAATRDAVQRYRRIVSRGGWPVVPGPRSIRPGDYDDRVSVLRKRLRIEGDMPPEKSYYEGMEFDEADQRAVAAFQRRNGLRITKRVDRATFAALNVPADMRLQQLELNYRRIQNMLNERVADRYILVNAPAFQLEAVEKYEVKQRHRVIAGRTERQTPEIRATIKGLNFFPYWRVPISVAKYDLVPRMKKDPGYLERERIRAFKGSYDGEEIPISQIDWDNVDHDKIKFRQDPGDWNALGLVRIDMPNSETVYMHDTPMKKLFGQASRAYSAGCVRVQNVFDLADWLANKELGWDKPGNAEAIVEAGSPLDLTLTRPVPVIFTYITAWAEQDGTVHFRRDIYNRDGSRAFAGDMDDDELGPPLEAKMLSP